MIEDENIHAGHRDRLLNLVYKAGLENVSDVQQVEQFLTYIFPRGDTNPLAHRLLKKFGNFSNMVNASFSELTSVRGIGKSTAMKIMMFPKHCQVFEAQMLSYKQDLNNYGNLCDFCEGLLRTCNTEELHLLALNASGKLTRRECLAKGAINFVGIPARVVVNFILSTNAAVVVLIHNHPGGFATPSKKDVEGTKYLEDIILHTGCVLADHIIVGSDGVYGIKKEKYIRTYMIDGVDLSKV